MAGVCGGGRTLARGPGAARAHAAAAAQRGRAQPCLAALRARRSTCAAASSNGSSANGNGTSSSNGSGAPGLHAAPGPLAAAGSAAPQPAGSADAPAARPAALSSRDGAAARSAKRLQTHARRELLSRAWAVVAGGAADVARFRGARSITPPARVAAREAHVAAGAGDGRGEAIGDVIGRMLYNYYLWWVLAECLGGCRVGRVRAPAHGRSAAAPTACGVRRAAWRCAVGAWGIKVLATLPGRAACFERRSQAHRSLCGIARLCRQPTVCV